MDIRSALDETIVWHQRIGVAIAALVAANICLSFGPFFVRLTDVGPIAAGFWRLALAVPVLFFLCSAVRQPAFSAPRGTWLAIALAGLFFAADLASWHIGIHYTKLANATLFGNSASLMFPLYGFLIARIWPNRMQTLALALGAIGTALLMGKSYELSASNLIGDLLCLLAGIFYTFYFIALARARQVLAPLPILALSTAAGLLPLLAASTLLGERIWPDNWSPLLFLALGSQVVGQGLMIFALGRLQPLIFGLALLTQPVMAAGIGWVAFDERLTLADLGGAIAVACALVLVAVQSAAPATDSRKTE